MDLQLTSKTALVTGSTAGIGFAIAHSLAREGATVIVNGRTEQRVKTAMEQLGNQSKSWKIDGVAADVEPRRRKEDHRALSKVDILVNNAGIFEPKAFEQIADQDWLRLFEVNVMSGVRLSRHLLPPDEAAELGPYRFYLE